jgi:hypothetical protein
MILFINLSKKICQMQRLPTQEPKKDNNLLFYKNTFEIALPKGISMKILMVQRLW